jgi:hypothetical protein
LARFIGGPLPETLAVPSPHPIPHQADLARQVQLVERNAQLLIAELREARRQADQTAATLSLFLGLMAQTREADGGYLLHRLLQDLLICAQAPDLASRIAGCDVGLIDPYMIRASAALLSGDVGAIIRSTLGESGAPH